MAYVIERLDRKKHERKGFHSGSQHLDDYIKRRARQDQDRDMTTCYVLVDEPSPEIIGYYTLSQFQIARQNLPATLLAGLPSYSGIPATMLGRLAVEKSYRGRGIGSALLFDALARAAAFSSQVSSWCVVVDPIDGDAMRFYAQAGFQALSGTERMFMPMGDIRFAISELDQNRT